MKRSAERYAQQEKDNDSWSRYHSTLNVCKTTQEQLLGAVTINKAVTKTAIKENIKTHCS